MTAIDDTVWMARAIALARKGLYTTDPNPRVGCVIVRDGANVGEGFHQRAGEPHAEIYALQTAGELARGATVYVSLEPCAHHGRTPPCADALIEAGVTRVVLGAPDPNPRVAGQGIERLRAAGIEVTRGVLEQQATALNPGFNRRMLTGLPWVRVKLAMSLDGRTAMASGESRWITGESARRDAHRLRAMASAILTGSATVLADDPELNVRLDPEALGIEGEVRQPLRVVLDSALRIDPGRRLLTSSGGQVLVMTTSEDDAHRQALEKAGAEVTAVPGEAGHIALEPALRLLGDREVNEVLVEAGPTLCGALLEAGLVNEVVIYMAPHLMGDRARGLVTLPSLERMAQRIALRIDDIRAVGEDWRISGRVESE
jgi:diaminohydroxyphosphoribosylaminopyrimidine deaminase/5-amino-6-(5-phosphoribosylamino)uracil reductase